MRKVGTPSKVFVKCLFTLVRKYIYYLSVYTSCISKWYMLLFVYKRLKYF